MIDADGSYSGTVTARAAAEALTDLEQAPETIGELAELPATATTRQTLADALHLLIAADGTGLPVFDHNKTALVGWITHQSVLSALRPPTGSGVRDVEAGPDDLHVPVRPSRPEHP